MKNIKTFEEYSVTSIIVSSVIGALIGNIVHKMMLPIQNKKRILNDLKNKANHFESKIERNGDIILIYWEFSDTRENIFEINKSAMEIEYFGQGIKMKSKISKSDMEEILRCIENYESVNERMSDILQEIHDDFNYICSGLENFQLEFK